MQKMTPTAVMIAGTDPGEIKLDLQIKKVLACKPILSMILKEVVRYDIMEAIIINISKIHNKGENKNVLVSMLTDLLNEDLDKESKLKALEAYGIPMTVEIKEEVDCMCTYTTYVVKTSEERGEKRGEKQGRKLGEAKLGHLMQVLFDKGLIEEARKASEDEAVRKELYRKYNIID